MAKERLTLTYHEVTHAATVGLARHWSALKRSLRETNGSERANHWFTHQLGAIGELAVAKALSVHWSGNVGKEGRPDIVYKGLSIEVRAVTDPRHRLIVHPEDQADFFVLTVLDELPCVKIAGAISAAGAKTAEFWQDPQGGRPAFFVPAQALSSLHILQPVPATNE